MIVQRKRMNWWERLYLSAVFSGLWVTVRRFFRRKVTMQYPEERWVPPEGYRGMPCLVRDQEGHVKCVCCQLCEFICPPKAIRITPPGPDGPPPDRPAAEKAPLEFKIDLLRCIFCGLCEEVCPEEAIFMRRDHQFTAERREELVFDKEELLRRGGTHHDRALKWKRKEEEAKAQGAWVEPAWSPAETAGAIPERQEAGGGK